MNFTKMQIKALEWNPEEDDKYGKDKKIFLKFIVENCSGKKNALKIEIVIQRIAFEIIYTKESFQHHILVPLREENSFFIGTSNKGIYFIVDANDALFTIDFYTKRIRSETKHLRNLKKILKKEKSLTQELNYSLNKKKKNSIYFDESGTPSMNNLENDPYFIVTGVIIESRKGKPILEIDKKLAYIKEVLYKPQNFEFKSNRLNENEYRKVLIELSTLNYEFISVCFNKKELYGEGFKYPKVFYKYAFDILLKKIMDYIDGPVDLFFDQYSNKDSSFEQEFLEYIKKNNIEFKFNNNNLDMFNSSDHPFIQLSDLLAGVIKFKMKKSDSLFEIVEEKCIDFSIFPYENQIRTTIG